MSSYLSIIRLILVGARKNYVIPFNPGVNIVYGDSDTGKSSILEFISYLLGSSGIELADEMISSINYAAMEIDINEKIYTIKRDIYNSSEYVEVFSCSFEDCDNYFPEKYSPNFKDTKSPNGFYSDFLLNSLNFPKVKIKEAPTKSNSKIKRLGFRGIFKFCYLNQDDVGSKGFLDQGNWGKAVRNREIFKYIFNVLDSSISEIDAEISEKTREGSELKQKYEAVSEFLRETDYESLSAIDDLLESIDSDVESFRIELDKINKTMVADSQHYSEIKTIFNQLVLNDKSLALEISKIEDRIDKYSRLKNDYENDIDKIRGLKLARERIGEASLELSPCPICDGEIRIEPGNVPFIVSPNSSIEDELKSLTKRRKNINDFIESQSSKYRGFLKSKILIQKDLEKARELLDTESNSMITPYLTQRDAIVKEIAAKEQVKEKYLSDLKIRNQQDKLYKKYKSLESDIAILKEKLSELKDKAPSMDDILCDIGDLLNRYLKHVNIKNRKGISISSNTFVPVIRDRDYFKITSGGLRTITSIGHMLSILEYATGKDINHPRLLMIDTVGKYLGKTTKSKYVDETDARDDLDEGMSDPLKYRNIYESVLGVASRAEIKGSPCQIILVDNDVPAAFVERYKGFIVAHYSATGEDGLSVGLIDDINEVR